MDNFSRHYLKKRTVVVSHVMVSLASVCQVYNFCICCFPLTRNRSPPPAGVGGGGVLRAATYRVAGRHFKSAEASFSVSGMRSHQNRSSLFLLGMTRRSGHNFEEAQKTFQRSPHEKKDLSSRQAWHCCTSSFSGAGNVFRLLFEFDK